MRVRACRLRAYSSKTTARVLETQLEVACKLYNTLLHAEQEEYERNRRSMNKTELRQLALDLRKKNPEFQVLHSQVTQQVADRFYQARKRFLDGLANKPKKKKPHRYLSLVYPQSGWKLSDTREVGLGKNKKKKAWLYLSKIGFFTLIVHRVLPESQVSSVRQTQPFRSNPRFLVEEPESQEQHSSEEGEPVKAVGVGPGDHKACNTLRWRFLENPKPLERSLDRVRLLQRTLSRKRFLSKNWIKTKIRLAKEHEHLKEFQARLVLQARCLARKGVRPLGIRRLKHQGFDSKWNQKKKASALRLLVLRTQSCAGVAVCKAR